MALPPACILVVEDDASIRLGLLENLDAEGYRVRAATDVETGLRAACEHDVDLLVLDRMLPDGDGLEILTGLRRRGVKLPVIVLTARGEGPERVAALTDGADDYIVKPFSLAELLARIKAVLRRTRPDVGETLAVGACVLDLSGRTLRRGPETIGLSRREFDLLLHLARHPGRVFSRAQILDAVWGLSSEAGERVVDRFVTTLRKKVEPDPRNPRHILTVPGVGYRFDGS